MTRQSHQAAKLQQLRRHRRTQGGGKRRRRHEGADHRGALAGGKPDAEIIDDAGKEPRLGKAQQETHCIVTVRPDDKGIGRGHDAPADHQHGDPDTGADPAQHQVGRHPQQEISREEQPPRQPEHGVRETQILVHGQGGEADIHPVQEGHEVKQHEERHQPPADPG